MCILKKPLVTEKASSFHKRGVYGLIVDVRAGKEEIRREVERFYKVKVGKVNTMRCSGKAKILHRANAVIHRRRPSYKKVFVTLKEGIIDFYSNI